MSRAAGMVFMRAAWPAFMAACALEVLVFAMVDPQDLHWAGHALELSRHAVYTGAFFLFWLVSAAACALTVVLGGGPGLRVDRTGD